MAYRTHTPPIVSYWLFGVDTFCLHPTRSGVVVRISFSHRHPRGARSASPRQDLETFYRSLRFH